MESDREYFERRAGEEREAAETARTPEARAIHLQLARNFAELAASPRFGGPSGE